MYIQHILFLVLKIQTVLPCVHWVEPLDAPEFGGGDYKPGWTCCGDISWGNQVYSYVGKESTHEYNCNSPCVYTRVDIPHSKYCFTDGGNVYTECDKNSVAIGWYKGMEPARHCVTPGTNITFYAPIDEPNPEDQTCFKVTELSSNITKEICDKSPYSFIPENSGKFLFASDPEAKEGMQAAIFASDACYCESDYEPEALSKLSGVLRSNEEFFHEKSPTNFSEFMKQIFKLHLLLINKDQTKVLRNALPCSEVSKECEKCFKDVLEATLYCTMDHEQGNSEPIFFANSACKSGILASNVTCRSCFCEIGQVCFPDTQTCKKDEHRDTVNKTEDSHPCDRKCEGSEPLRCVYNLNLTNLDSNGERPVLAYNGTIPGPQIVICEGDELVVNLHNNIIQSKNKGKDTNTTLHFHGIREMNRPWADGVPWVSQVPISPGENFTYGFNATKRYGTESPAGSYDQAGTYWYHSHVKDQRTNGAYGAFIIKLKQTEPDTRFDVDEPKYTIILQEWYESYTTPTVTRLLVNGHGRVDNTNAKFEVEPNKRYMFRIIGAISEDVPLRLSIDNHTFTAIAADSQDIQPVHNLTSLWVAGGERFHIVVQTLNDTDYEQNSPAFKIRVFGVSNPNVGNKHTPHCTIAWLKYPTQATTTSNENYDSCEGFELPSPHRSLNPVPNSYKWDTRLEDGNIAISDLRAKQLKPSLNFFGETLLNTQYIEFEGITFNNLSMKYSDVPILKQKPETEIERCGTVCNFTVLPTLNVTLALDKGYIHTNCSEDNTYCSPKKRCECQHVIQQPFAPFYWTEMVLINNNRFTHAHPIHQHGGWYWVVGMGQYSESINRTFIMHQDRDCNNVPYYTAMKNGKKNCLHRNLYHPPAKDTVQVPPGGYVIIRTPLDNKGAWIIHCHINRHVIGGMAMVLNIGGYGYYNKSLNQAPCTGHSNEQKGTH